MAYCASLSLTSKNAPFDAACNRDAILSHTVDVVTVATYLYVRIVMYRLYNHTVILLRSRSNVNNDIFSYNSNAH